MRVLFIHEISWRSTVTFEMHELPELLSLRGHDIDFLDFPEGVRPSGFRRILDLKTTVEWHQSRTYKDSAVRVFTPGRVFAKPLDRLTASFTFIPLLLKLLRRNQYQVIFLYSVPTTGWQTVLIARLLRIPVLFRAIDVPHEIRRSVFRSLIRVAERFVYRNATWVSANNSELLDYCRAFGASTTCSSVDFAGLDPLKVVNCNDVSQEIRDRFGVLAGERVVCYLGTLFRFSGLDRVIAELAESGAELDNYKLVIAGSGEQLPILQKQIRDLEMEERVRLVGRIGFDEISNLFSISNIGLIPFEQLPVSHLAFPWKSVQYLLAGLPVIASELRGLKTVFEEGAGVTYVGCHDSYSERIQSLLENPWQSRVLAQRGHDVVLDKFLWTKNIVEFERLLETTIARGDSR